MPGFGTKTKILFSKRLEWTFFKNLLREKTLLNYSKESRKKILKTINIILSQINNVNNDIYSLNRLNIIRLYLIKSYRGYCHMLGKPVKGQRTWSNA
jgi:ribosomal protein S13